MAENSGYILGILESQLSSLLGRGVCCFIANNSPISWHNSGQCEFCLNVRLVKDWKSPMAIVSFELSVKVLSLNKE